MNRGTRVTSSGGLANIVLLADRPLTLVRKSGSADTRTALPAAQYGIVEPSALSTTEGGISDVLIDRHVCTSQSVYTGNRNEQSHVVTQVPI